MSDCKAIYRKSEEFVKCLYPGEPPGFFHRNLNTLTSRITGIITGFYKHIHRANHCDLSLSQLGLRLLRDLAVRALPIPLLELSIVNNS